MNTDSKRFVTVAKTFRWEGAHRLRWHDGQCSSLHGHSYRMVIEVDGPPDDHGMVIDFRDIKQALQPLVDAWDHGTLVHAEDGELLGVLRQMGWKHFVLPFDSTSENVACYAADYLCEVAGNALKSRGVTTVRVRIQETDTCFAIYVRSVDAEPVTPPEALSLVSMGMTV